MEPKHEVYGKDAFRAAYNLWHVKEGDLKSNTKESKVVWMRWIMFTALRERGLTLAYIGELFNRGHDTVIHGLNRSDEEMLRADYRENYSAFQDEFNKYIRGGDPYPSVSVKEGDGRAIIGRQNLTNIGGFSDYEA